jgi:hypothetical protein
MKAVGTCPICKIQLSINSKDAIRYCSQCRREFYCIEEQKTKLQLEYGDLETIGESGSSFPVLLADETDYRGFPESRQKKKDYLQKYFENTTITSREYIPT